MLFLLSRAPCLRLRVGGKNKIGKAYGDEKGKFYIFWNVVCCVLEFCALLLSNQIVVGVLHLVVPFWLALFICFLGDFLRMFFSH